MALMSSSAHVQAAGKPTSVAQSVPKLSFTIPEFCSSVGISETTYAKLKRQRKHPREMQILKSVRISYRAAADWIAQREAARESNTVDA